MENGPLRNPIGTVAIPVRIVCTGDQVWSLYAVMDGVVYGRLIRPTLMSQAETVALATRLLSYWLCGSPQLGFESLANRLVSASSPWPRGLFGQ
jgi:hypothetical protein